MSIEAMKLALFALDIVKIHYTQNRHINEAIAALKERLADPMREVQRLGQEIEQEPVALHCCGYTDASAVKWNPLNGVVQCHNCGQTYTPPQRTEQEPVETVKESLQVDELLYEMLDTLPYNTPEYWMGRIKEVLSFNTHPPQRTEQNFCSRCGKRTADLTHIHTCTPPKD